MDTVTYSMRSAEIHCSTSYRKNLTRCHVGSVRGSEIISINIEYLVITRFGEITTKIVVVVVGHVDDRFLVGSGFPNDVKGVVGSYLISGSGGNSTGESIFSVWSYDGEFENRVTNLFGIIDFMHPSGISTSVKAMEGIVLTQLVGCT